MTTRHSQNQEPDGATVAKLEADTVPFISLGEASQAVVMRLQVKLPRIKVSKEGRGRNREEKVSPSR
ncbi:hypothetical protein CN234_17425 [Sinorhizobium meliloti]|uniref:hypothetical protein n=1 Tax=Rhizobium meliloti TaxID=382 RepID=UPI000FDA7F79|nr:hypothetical protein [Sinorhizobium meliloti]RVG08563.1 hypothetical protein CN234_17425 [Sinorhizobium meliloti]